MGFAHRGGAAHGPDNALGTFREALRRGATGLETDAWVSSDRQVVLDHDGVLRAGLLRRRPISQIRRADLPSQVASLGELYDECGVDFDLAIDVKSVAVAVAVAETARTRGADHRLWLVAPHSAMLRDVSHGNRVVTVKGTTMRGPRRRPTMRAIRDAGMTAVNARWPWWSTTFVAEAHDLGLLAFGYDVQQATSLRRTLDRGIDAVFSDHVDRMVVALRERAERPGS